MKRILSIVATSVLLATTALCCAEDGVDMLLTASKRARESEKIESFRASYELSVTNEDGKVEKSRRKIMIEKPEPSDFCYLNAPVEGVPTQSMLLLLRRGTRPYLDGRLMVDEIVRYDARAKEYVIDDSSWATQDFFLTVGRLGDWLGITIGNVAYRCGFDMEEAKKELKKTYQIETSESKIKINGEKSYEITVKSDDAVIGQYCITPEFGYVCSKSQMRYPSTNSMMEVTKDDLIAEFVSDKFIFDERSEVHYPLHIVVTNYGGGKNRAPRRTEYAIDEDSRQINKRIKPAEFALTIPQGAKIRDARGGKSVVKVAKEAFEIKLSDKTIDLTNLDALVDPE